MRGRSIALGAVMAAAIVTTVSAPAQADHSWNGYHWARSGAVQIEVHDSVTSDWDADLVTANNDWNQSSVLENSLVADDDSDGTRSSCPAISGAVRVCDYSYGSNGWAGLAEIDVSGDHILWGTAKMNDSYLGGDSPEMRLLVMCQEVGHDWGLGHQDEDFNNPNLGTCMDYTNDPSTNQHPNQHDYDQLESIYGHSDGAAATGAGTTTIRTGNRVTMITWAE